MADAPTGSQLLVARIAVAIGAFLILLGLVLYGFSAEVHHRIWRDIAARPGGPMTFRFVLQPCMAALAAFHDGRTDARLGRSPYLWTILTERGQGGGRLREGVIATSRIILLGFAMDAIYQATVLGTFYPGEMLLISVLLAFLPYVLLRGPFARLAGWRHHDGGRRPPSSKSER